MIADYKIISISHHTLSVNELDKFMIQHRSPDELILRLEQAKSRFGIDELLYLSTCNRVLFLAYANVEIDQRFVQKLFQYLNPEVQFKDEYHQYIDCYSGDQAVQYILEVAASLDSLVVGEREIFRQFRASYELCKAAKLTGDYLRILERYIVQTTKVVLSSTGIGDHSVSIVSLAATKMLAFDLPKNARIIMVGAGETNRLFANWLSKHDLNNVVIFNRNVANAEAIKNIIPAATAQPLSELKNYNHGFDVLLACTAAMEHLVTCDIYTCLTANDTNKKLLIDLAVPNNIDKKIREQHSVEIIDIEELRSLADDNLALRRQAVTKAKAIVLKQLDKFKMTYRQREIEKKFSQLPHLISSIKDRAINDVYSDQIAELSPEAQDLVHEMMNYMVKKCVGIPMKVAREAAELEKV